MKKILVLALATTTVSAGMFDGVYSGINLGWAAPEIKTSIKNANGLGAHPSKKVTANTVALGAQAGYAKICHNHVYMAGEVMFNYEDFSRKTSGISSSGVTGLPTTGMAVQGEKVFDLTAAAKLGYRFHHRAIAYVGGFVGAANYKTRVLSSGVNTGAPNLGTRFVGGPLVGAEFRMTERLSAGLEGRVDFASKKTGQFTINGNTYNAKIEASGFDLRGRVNFAF